MVRRFILTLTFMVLASLSVAQTLRVFVASTQRPDILEPILARYSEETGVSVELELGGATSEQRAQYLSTVLGSQSGEIDIYAFDVIDPLRFSASGWVEPLNDYFESDEAMMDYLEAFLPGEIEANLIDGTLYGLPYYTDAQFLYYRSDLLDEYGFAPPTTWAELEEQALAITEGEGDDNLQGFNYQGAAIEGAVCTFLEALWTAGGDWRDEAGNITVDSDEGRTALEWYQNTLDSGITTPAIAEMTTDLSRQQFQAGDVTFMLNWGYAWSLFQGEGDEETAVAGNVGVAPLPAFEGGESATCVGGFQWAMNPHSDNKEAAFELMQYLANEDNGRLYAALGSFMPSRQVLYEDAEVLEANPHFEEFYDVIVNARPRPQTEFYGEVSELMRTTMNAFLAQSIDIDTALQEMQFGLEDILAN